MGNSRMGHRAARWVRHVLACATSAALVSLLLVPLAPGTAANTDPLVGFTVRAHGSDGAVLDPGVGMTIHSTSDNDCSGGFHASGDCGSFIDGTFINQSPFCSSEDEFPLHATDAPIEGDADTTWGMCWERQIRANTSVTMTVPATTSVDGLTYTFDHWDTSGQSATCSEGNTTTGCSFIVPSPLGLNLLAVYAPDDPDGDTVDPAITITSPTSTAYLLNQSIGASYACTDAGGPPTCVGSVANGAQIDTASVGSKTFTVNAEDNAGNTASATVSYSVQAGFVGFQQPVDNSAVNVANAGKTIPVKWRIVDANGAPVTTWPSVTVTATSLSCSLGSTPDLIEEYAAGASGLQNLGNGYYQFNWATPKSYANSCKTLHLGLGDGADHTAQFQFKK
jgi:hypothetical protein